MGRDIALGGFDVLVTLALLALALAAGWWWALLAPVSAYVAYRQLLLARYRPEGAGLHPR